MDKTLHEKIAGVIGMAVGQGVRDGRAPADVVQELQLKMDAAKLPIRLRWVEVLPGVGGVHVELGEASKDGKAETTNHEIQTRPTHEKCPGPHAKCPACAFDLCFRRDPEGSPPPPTGICPMCSSFLVVEDEPPAPRLMTDQEVAELSDDERIRLTNGRRQVIHKRG